MEVVKYDSAEVQRFINKLSYELINRMLAGKEYTVLTLLDGGMFLTGELMRRLSNFTKAFIENKTMKVSSYHDKNRGELKFDYVPDVDWKGKRVIVIDDFCDSGNTINQIYRYLKDHEAETIEFYTLLAREGYQLDPGVVLHYGKLDDTKNFYIGCGLDDNGYKRHVDYIYYINDEQKET